MDWRGITARLQIICSGTCFNLNTKVVKLAARNYSLCLAHFY